MLNKSPLKHFTGLKKNIKKLWKFQKSIVFIYWGYHSKMPQIGGLNDRNSFSQSSVNWSPIQATDGFGFSESSVLGLQMTIFLLCLHMTCASIPVFSSWSYKGTNPVRWKLLWLHLELVTSLKHMSPNTANSHFLRYTGK